MSPLEVHTSVHREKFMRRIYRRGAESVFDIPYENYLRTELWNAIRDWVIKSQSGKCAICDHDAAEVHHHDYEEATLLGLRSSGLVGLCARCHNLIEFDDARSKRVSLIEKREVFEHLASEFTCLRQEGFRVVIEISKLTINLEYIGNKTFLQFISCSSLAYSFIIKLFLHSEMAFPLPFGREKLKQKSGVVLTLRESAKKMATVKAAPASIQIKLTKTCAYPFEASLRDFLAQEPFVRVVP
ncbi:hypothetical protein [Rhodoferax sp. GW822-FHT02A01]|uniref:hypothetical protein n=1 Tax=Rhodoferax sp. GW822-FHT02A01 TaxID=3141537 RepID=UPI00315CC199